MKTLVILLVLIHASGGCPPRGVPPPSQAAAIPAPVPAAAHLEPGPPMGMPHATHTATALIDGTVLVAGTMTEGAPREHGSSAELFDPVRAVWRPLPHLTVPRAGHQAALLPTGRVLIMGGWSNGQVQASTDVFDPMTRQFTPGPAMTAPRGGFTVSTLRDGRLLLVGGEDTPHHFLASAELFDPHEGRFLRSGTMATTRSGHAAARLLDGRVLICGGHNGLGVNASAELFDPLDGRFTKTGAMSVVRHKHGAIGLPDGTALIVGGSDARDGAGTYKSAERYDPWSGSGRFTPLPDMAYPRYKIPDALIMLADGTILIGGSAIQAERFDPASGTFTTIDGTMDKGWQFAAVTALPNGRALIAGGYTRGNLTTDTTWIYVPATP